MEFLKALYILGPLHFLLYTRINHLPLSIISVSTTVLFVDDTSMIITEPDVQQLAESAYHIFTVIPSTKKSCENHGRCEEKKIIKKCV
jgi:hypothetical protein